MRVPATVINHRQLTCLLPSWKFAQQRVVFRLFRGCCARQHQQEQSERRAIQQQQASAAAGAGVAVGSYDMGDTSSYWINNLGVSVGPSGGAANRRLLSNSTPAEDVPGDMRYIWNAVQLTIKGIDVAGSIPFFFSQGWRFLQPSCGVIGDGTRIQISGYGFNASAPYVCVFSGTGTGNISTYSDELQVPAGVFLCNALLLQ
jgi:hypothetical protein